MAFFKFFCATFWKINVFLGVRNSALLFIQPCNSLAGVHILLVLQYTRIWRFRVPVESTSARRYPSTDLVVFVGLTVTICTSSRLSRLEYITSFTRLQKSFLPASLKVTWDSLILIFHLATYLPSALTEAFFAALFMILWTTRSHSQMSHVNQLSLTILYIWLIPSKPIKLVTFCLITSNTTVTTIAILDVNN